MKFARLVFFFFKYKVKMPFLFFLFFLIIIYKSKIIVLFETPLQENKQTVIVQTADLI